MGAFAVRWTHEVSGIWYLVMASPSLSLVAAVAENGVIGREGRLPWSLPNDLRRFRRLTMGNTVLMGRRTWDSLGHALEGRENWVVTHSPIFSADRVRVFHSLEDVFNARPCGCLMVIGGADLYRQTLPMASHLDLTLVHARVEGDTYFPVIDESEWVEVNREQHGTDDRHAIAYDFVTFERRRESVSGSGSKSGERQPVMSLDEGNA